MEIEEFVNFTSLGDYVLHWQTKIVGVFLESKLIGHFAMEWIF